MKHLAAILLLLAAAAAYGQTVKSLGYNTTNGHVVYAGTNALTFTNGLGFSTNAANTTRTNLGVAPAPIFKVLTNNFSITNQTNFVTVDGLTIPTEAGKTYVVKLVPILSSSANGLTHIIVASNAIVEGNWNLSTSVNFVTNKLTNVASALNVNDASATRAPQQLFYVVGGTNSGSVSFQISHNVTNVSSTVHSGSFILAQEVNPQ